MKKHEKKYKKRYEKKVNKLINIVKEHISKNIKQYLIFLILFFIGIIIGTIFVNNIQIDSKTQVDTYIITCIEKIKSDYEINYIELLRNISLNHILFTILVWFLGCSVIGMPIVYLLIVYKGFSLGYTISIIITALGIEKGILFSFISLLPQNLLIIPAILALGVSGMNLYMSIIKNKRIDNMKVEIIKHTAFSTCMLMLLIFSAIIEVYISNSLLKLCITCF